MAKRKAAKTASAKTKKKAPAKKTPAKKSPAKKTAAPRTAARPARKAAAPVKGVAPNSATIGMTVDDVAQSMAFYCDLLGFAVKQRWERDGALSGGELAAGDISLYIGQDDWKKGKDRKFYVATIRGLHVGMFINAHGGKVKVESSTAGTIFRVRLPMLGDVGGYVTVSESHTPHVSESNI